MVRSTRIGGHSALADRTIRTLAPCAYGPTIWAQRAPASVAPVSVPVIDVAPLVGGGTEDDVRAVAQAIDTAWRDLGFFVSSGQGIDATLRRPLDDTAREFFALPDETKAAIAMPRAGIAWRGWFPVGGELTSGRPDLKEGIYFGEEHGPDHPGVLARRPLHGANLFPEQPALLRPLVLD